MTNYFACFQARPVQCVLSGMENLGKLLLHNYIEFFVIIGKYNYVLVLNRVTKEVWPLGCRFTTPVFVL